MYSTKGHNSSELGQNGDKIHEQKNQQHSFGWFLDLFLDTIDIEIFARPLFLNNFRVLEFAN